MAVIMTYSASTNDRLLAAQAKMFINSKAAVIGNTISTGDTVTLTANSGRLLTAGGNYFDTAFSPSSADHHVFTLTGGGVGAYLNTSFIGKSVVANAFQTVAGAPPTPPKGSYKFTSEDIIKTSSAQAKMRKNDSIVSEETVFLKEDTFKAIANPGRRFSENSVYFQDIDSGAMEYFTISDNKTEATYVNLYGTSLGGYSISTEAIPVPAVPSHVISDLDIQSFLSSNSKLFLNGIEAKEGDKLFTGDVLTATSNAGWVFFKNPNAPDGFISVQFRESTTNSLEYFSLVGVDYKKGEYKVPSYVTWNSVFEVQTILEQPEDVKGFNNVYEVDNDQLKLITQSRWVSPPDGGEQTDYGKYILGLINLPFKISPDMVVNTQDVRLGPRDTNIPANFLNSDTIRLPLGKIQVVGTKGNFLDYKDTIAMLHLPYCDSVAIDLEYVIDQTVSVEYLISLYDGTAVVNVTSSKTGDIVLTQNIDMNITIPFANINTYPSKNAADSVKLGGDNGIRTAFIELLRNDAVLESGFFTIPIIDEKQMSGYTGFARVEEINLASKATSYEKELIVNKLNAGVIIK